MKTRFFQGFVVSCALLLFSGFAAHASEASEPVSVQLVAEENAIQPGHPFWVGVELSMDKGWDTYWKNPGDAGFPTQVDWQLPKGFTAGPILWPFPEKFENESLVAFGYTDKVVLLTQITPPKNLPADQQIHLKAEVSWLACKDACVPGNASLDIALPVTDGQPTLNETAKALFTNARKALPQQEGNVSIQTQADQIVLSMQSAQFADTDELLFIPDASDVVDYTAPQKIQKEGDQVTLNVKRAQADAKQDAVTGVLVVSGSGGVAKRAIQVDSQISNADVAKSSDAVSSVAVALGLAFLGGLILNVMPCVLPVIALKIFGFVKMAQENRRVIFQHGAVFSFGVLISFWILSGALLVLRSYGEGIGWGFQLQEPVFVAILAGMLFLLGLSLFGVFELGASLISLGGKTQSSKRSPLMSSFMSGILATLVATPCTGPLLGPALGFAMTLPPVSALAIFTSMGIGMSFPYLLFSMFPQLVRFLPKPGNWMIVFKQIMGFLMMATVVWLVWVFGAQTDNMATFVMLAALLIMAIGAWIFGKWGAPTRRRSTRIIATLLAGVILLTGGGSVIKTATQHRDLFVTTQDGTTRLVSENGWEAYSPERVQELRAKGTPVFVDFTAKWCLICQANKVTLHSADIQKAFAEKGVVTMSADWTKKDPIITEQLDKLGRTGVPVYVLYPGDLQTTPYILPQTLTANVVREYVDKLPVPSTTVYVD